MFGYLQPPRTTDQRINAIEGKNPDGEVFSGVTEGRAEIDISCLPSDRLQGKVKIGAGLEGGEQEERSIRFFASRLGGNLPANGRLILAQDVTIFSQSVFDLLAAEADYFKDNESFVGLGTPPKLRLDIKKDYEVFKFINEKRLDIYMEKHLLPFLQIRDEALRLIDQQIEVLRADDYRGEIRIDENDRTKDEAVNNLGFIREALELNQRVIRGKIKYYVRDIAPMQRG